MEINEPVDLLGFRSLHYLVRDQVSEDSEVYEKNTPRHIIDIGFCAYLRGLFFSHNEDIGQKGSLQRAHKYRRNSIVAATA